jgi:hypothetical protein
LSSFGARLRSRLPQYGHSVMYGLTSDPQDLHTTKRSGCPATRAVYVPPSPAPLASTRSATSSLESRLAA